MKDCQTVPGRHLKKKHLRQKEQQAQRRMIKKVMKLQSWPDPDRCYVDDAGSLDPGSWLEWGISGDPDA